MKVLIYKENFSENDPITKLCRTIFSSATIEGVSTQADFINLLDENTYRLIILEDVLRSESIQSALLSKIKRQLLRPPFIISLNKKLLFNDQMALESKQIIQIQKPYDIKLLKENLQHIHFALETLLPTRYFTYENRSQSIKIPEEDILYFETSYKTCTIHTIYRKEILIRYPLKSILEQTSDNFLQVHRSIVVNKRMLYKMTLENHHWTCYLTQCPTPIPVGEKYLKSLRATFSNESLIEKTKLS